MRVILDIPIIDSYCDGVSTIEKTGNGNVRLWCYAGQASQCGAGPLENVLVAKLVMPGAALIPLLLSVMGALDIDNPAALNEAVAAARQIVHH